MQHLLTTLLPLALLGTAMLNAQEPPATGAIAGMAIGESSEALPLAEVWAEIDGEVVARTHADGNGWFLLGHLPRRWTLLRARVPGTRTGALKIDLCEGNPKTTYVSVPTCPVRTIRGRVLAADGGPAPHALVVVQPSSRMLVAECVERTAADAEGRFTVRDVTEGHAWVRAWLPGNGVAQYSVAAQAGDAEANLQLDGEDGRKVRIELRSATAEQLRTCVFRLRAQDDSYVALPQPLERCQPDASGAVELSGIPATLRVRWVTAQVAGAVVWPPRDLVPKGPPEWTVHFDVLGPGEGWIRGTLRDDKGKPLAGRRLLCQPLDRQIATEPQSGMTDDHGRFAVLAPVGERESFALRLADEEMVLDCEHGERAYRRAWYVARHQPGELHELTAIAGTRLELRVTDGADLPVPCAHVLITSPFGDDWAVVGTGTTDWQGHCRLAGLNPEAQEIHASVMVNGRRPMDFGPFTVTAGKSLVDLGTLTLLPDATARR